LFGGNLYSNQAVGVTLMTELDGLHKNPPVVAGTT
jgi:hypothetical protein